MSKINPSQLRKGNVVFNKSNNQFEVIDGIWKSNPVGEYWASNTKGGYFPVSSREPAVANKEFIRKAIDEMSEYIVLSDRFISGLKYVHQVQNLYMDIMNKDIKYETD